MATLLWFEDFESYPAGNNTITAPWVNTGPAGPSFPDSLISATVFHSATKSLGVGVGGGSALGAGWVIRDFGADLSIVTVDLWVRMTSGFSANDPPVSNAPGFVLQNIGDATNQLSFLVGGMGTVYVGQELTPNWFQFSITLDTWHHIRWATTIGSSGSSSMVVDGGAPMTFSGDTRPGSGADSTVGLINCRGQFVASGPSGPEIFFDDISIYNGIYTPVSPPSFVGCGNPHSDTEITPVWTNTADAPYTLRYRINGTSTWSQINNIAGTSFTITGLRPGQEYEWQVAGMSTSFGSSGFCFTDRAQFIFLSCENAWTVTQPVTQIWGFDHMIGMSVVGLLDGIPMAPQIVAADGSITLPFPASNVKIGLPFLPQLQSPRLDAGSPTVQGRRKAVSALTARLNRSGSPQLGTNQTDGSTTSPQSLAPDWINMTTVPLQPQQGTQAPAVLTYLSPAGQPVTLLQTGDLRTTVNDTWAKPGQLAIQQPLPLPLEVLSIMPELLEGDITEQGFAQEQKPQQHPDQRRQHQGPGAWMLRR